MNKFKDVIPIVSGKTGSEFAVTLLSDAEHRVIDRYGLRNEEMAARGEFLPHPTTYVIGSTGKVRWKFTEKNQAVRPANEVILSEIRKLW
jgi:peroxiredoxin